MTALKSDLDEWVRSAGRSTNGSVGPFAEVAAMAANLRMKRQEMRMLSTQLREHIQRTRGLIPEARELASRLQRY